jgi:polysaccharide biosynthesis/export protein
MKNPMLRLYGHGVSAGPGSLFVVVLLCAASLAYTADVVQPAKETKAASAVSDDYPLGPGDQILIWALGAEEISDRPVRIDANGDLDLPLIGRVHAGGATVDALRQEITRRLKNHVKEPRVAVNVSEFRSQPISVMGAVNHPGVYQLQGRKTLAEALSVAEGPRTDAGNWVYIRRSALDTPLEGGERSADGDALTSRVSLKSVMVGTGSKLYLAPNDVITVPRSAVVYVIGEVHKPGGFVIGERESISILESISMAEGIGRTSSPEKARLLRRNGSGARTEIAVDVRRILQAKQEDLAMQPEDILFIPNSRIKSGMSKALETAATAIGGVVIYRVGLPR